MSKDIIIVGKGEIGDKAERFVKFNPKFKKMGWNLPLRFIFAENFTTPFFTENDLGNNLKDASKKGITDLDFQNKGFPYEMSYEIFKSVSKITGRPDSIYWKNPFIFRSSEKKGGMGIGVYDSETMVLGNETNSWGIRSNGREIHESFLRVLKSYFSQSAKEFRRKLKVEEGFGIILEPLIGKWRRELVTDTLSEGYHDIFFPLVSGTYSNGEINLVHGLGGGVDTNQVYNVKLSEFKSFDYLVSLKNHKLKYFNQEMGITNQTYIDKNNFKEYNSGNLVDLINKTNDFFGRDQYLEFVGEVNAEGKMEYFLVQNSESVQEEQIFEVMGLKKENPFFEGELYKGKGNRLCKNIIVADWNSVNGHMREINNKHNDYIFIFDMGHLASQIKMGFDTYSNAKVLLPNVDRGWQQAGSLGSHFDNLSLLNNSLLGYSTGDLIKSLGEPDISKDGIKIYKGDYVASANLEDNKIEIFRHNV